MTKVSLFSEIDENYNQQGCSFMSCQTCHCINCETGQMARNHGRKGYESVLKDLELAYKNELLALSKK